jgi:hypothetical protein
MSTQPNIRAFSYRDEEALVRHLVGDLERKLSGRHETRNRNSGPSPVTMRPSCVHVRNR